MTVYVDELQVWSHAKHRCFFNGSAHLEADTLEELHAFAKKLGLKREWFQPRSSPHYDLSPAKHAMALMRGARFRSSREWALEKGCRRRRPDFEIVECITAVEGVTYYARWTHEGQAHAFVGTRGVDKVTLLGECFRSILCAEGYKLNEG
jgi:hypothetical protein